MYARENENSNDHEGEDVRTFMEINFHIVRSLSIPPGTDLLKYLRMQPLLASFETAERAVHRLHFRSQHLSCSYQQKRLICDRIESGRKFSSSKPICGGHAPHIDWPLIIIPLLSAFKTFGIRIWIF
jgi:hypothetical protein